MRECGNLYAAGQGPSLSTGLTQPFCSLLSLEDNSRSKSSFEGLPAIQLLLIQHTSGPPDDIMDGLRIRVLIVMEVCLEIGFIWLRMIMHEKNMFSKITQELWPTAATKDIFLNFLRLIS